MNDVLMNLFYLLMHEIYVICSAVWYKKYDLHTIINLDNWRIFHISETLNNNTHTCTLY